MLRLSDNLAQTKAALRAYRLRALLTMLGISMGVATIITVMTLIQGANLYVEQKIANLGTNVFQIARTPFAVTDFTVIIKALKNKHITLDDRQALAEHCAACEQVGARASYSARSRYENRELIDTNVIGQTANMASIDTRTVERGRFFTDAEDTRGAAVCLVGSKLIEELFAGGEPLNRIVRVGNQEFTVIGSYEKIGSVLGQEQDNYVVIPMGTFLKMRGTRFSITLEVKARSGGVAFEQAQEEARLALRARRHVAPAQEDGFFIGTADSYIELWKAVSSAFFAVFLMVSAISAVVGGIVIMNVMLVSVTERTKEIGIRRAMGATQDDIRRQFLTESVMQCILGGSFGILFGFLTALAVRSIASFPVSVQTWVALFGFALSSGIGLFFGIYPATQAARLDPIEALRRE